MINEFDGAPREECPHPYSDDYMIFDERTGHYILTEKYAFEQLGLELYEDVNDRNSANQQTAVNAILRRCSTLIYNFIHQCSAHDRRQDYIIATSPIMRQIIMEAMGEQLYYMSQVGDLSRSTDPEKRKRAIDKGAAEMLINSGICYSGV
ncbi:MAG: hypothetical protein OSJ39_00610 [Clostridia bacterium]|nr:hypothetical protein [Clostridia bacterium]